MRDRAPRHAGWWAILVTAGVCVNAASCGGDAFTTGDAGRATNAAAADVGAPDAHDSLDGGVVSPSDEGGVVSPKDAASIDAAPSGWCATHTGHTFCEDFDHYPSVNALFGSWSSFEQMNGSFKFDMTGAPSPPNALEAIGASGAKVIVLKTLPVTDSPKKLRLEFDLRIDSSGTVGPLSAVGLAAIAFGSAITDAYAALLIGSGPTLAGEWADATDGGASGPGTYQTANSTGAFPASGTWAGRYAIEVDYTTGCVQIYDGVTPLLASCLALPSALREPPKSISIVLGDYAGGVFASTGSIDVEFDDVTFDLL